MRFLISKEIAALYPALRIGVLLADGMTNGPDSSALQAETAERVKLFAESHPAASIKQDARVQLWRSVYAQMGFANHKQYQPTLEYTLERVAKGKGLPAISKVVTAYLLMELKFFLPCGGYDLARLTGNIHLRLSPGGESFLGIGQKEPNQTSPSEIVYADEEKVLTRVWNYRDADATKITHETSSAVLMVEAPTSATTSATALEAIEDIQTVLQRECGGNYKAFLADTAVAVDYALEY